jgi:hypothetical protein
MHPSVVFQKSPIRQKGSDGNEEVEEKFHNPGLVNNLINFNGGNKDKGLISWMFSAKPGL